MNYTVNATSRYEGEPVKGSRFIADVAPAADEDQARALLTRVAADFPDASHHCWAWRIASPPVDRASDDGEPSGSAGRPILSQLTGKDLVDTAVIVTRYFGGTKLGVGGLVRAYGGAAGEALDATTLIPWIAHHEVRFQHQYPRTDAIERAVAAVDGTIMDRSFEQIVVVRVQLPVDEFERFAAGIADATAGEVLLSAEDIIS